MAEGGADMLRHLEAGIATDVCVCQIWGCNENRCRGDDTLCRICVSSSTDPKIEDEELRAVRDYRSVLVDLDPADVSVFLAAAQKTQDLFVLVLARVGVGPRRGNAYQHPFRGLCRAPV